MKRSTILACSLLLPVLLTAQGRIYEIWTEPAAFMADEAVSVFFDVSGTVLDGISESEGVCVWTWFPSSPADAWGNPTDKTKLKHVEGNIWRWDLVPTELYNKPAGEINE
ncbi:MAG TPA: hypothetical protein PLK12_08305, partial [Prolixibacteraceae bacterium]|nr:hypothetical protein [Prolixibacteraceae bacterium]